MKKKEGSVPGNPHQAEQKKHVYCLFSGRYDNQHNDAKNERDSQHIVVLLSIVLLTVTYVECRVFIIIMLCVVTLNVIVLSVMAFVSGSCVTKPYLG